MGTATPTAILAILDNLTKSFTTIAPLRAYNNTLSVGTTILSQANSAGDINLVNTVGSANASVTGKSYELSTNQTPLGQTFTQIGSWLVKTGSTAANLDGYLTLSNAAVLYTYLASPVTAFQSYLAPGNSPIPNSVGVSPTNNYMTPGNVFAPVVTFGAANITGANTATYTNNLNLPTSNNSIQTVSVTGAAGTWTYTYKNVTSGAIAYNASASTAQTAINAVSTVGAGGVIVTSPSTGVYVVQNADAFTFVAGNANIPNAVVAGTGGATAVLQNASSATWQYTNTASGGSCTLQIGSTAEGLFTTATILYNAVPATVQTDLQALVPIGVNVVVTGAAGSMQIKLTGILANQRFDYNFLQVNQGTLSGGVAKLYQTVLGGLQGYTPPAATTAVLTTATNGTCTATVTANVVDTAGAFHAGRTFTFVANSQPAGTVIAFSLGTAQAGDRIMRITATTVAGTATAGAWDYVSTLDRVIS